MYLYVMNKQFLNYLQAQKEQKILQTFVDIQCLKIFIIALIFLLKSLIVTLV